MTEAAAEQNINISNETGNTSFTMPNTMTTQAEPTKEAPALMDVIPDSYKDKSWLSKYDSVEGLLKGFENAQELIGKRHVGIPQEGASPEEWNDFYKELGRPESADKYEISYGDELPEGLSVSDDQKAEFSKLAHEIGLTQKQVDALAKFDLQSKQQMIQSMQPDVEALDKEFNDFAVKAFGERQEEAITNANKLLMQYAPENMKEHLANLDNKSLIAMTSVLDQVTQKYMKEGTAHNGQAAPAQSKEDMRSQALELMRSDAFRQPFHPEHSSVRQKVEQLYNYIEN